VKIELVLEEKGDVWVASGNGLVRPIVAEGSTRSEAFHAYMSLLEQQRTQQRWRAFNRSPNNGQTS
tara:strand:+ start:5815 stop:6012 length:198 start_codon:yes stop_codon:yes gene_type:complete